MMGQAAFSGVCANEIVVIIYDPIDGHHGISVGISADQWSGNAVIALQIQAGADVAVGAKLSPHQALDLAEQLVHFAKMAGGQ